MTDLLITKEQARNYLIRYHHLTDDTALEGGDAIEGYVRKVGCVQFDPLDVVGYNTDLVLQSRLAGYRRGDIEVPLYRDRRLFDVWDKNMSVCSVGDWPYFSRTREYFRPQCEKFAPAIKTITAMLRDMESACSSDFGMDEKVSWYWGKQRLAKAALECMCHAGIAVVHHKKGTRRYYCLAENVIPRHLFEGDDPNATGEDYYRWLVSRRVGSIGLLWNRGGDAWLGTLDFKSEHRNLGFSSLVTDGMLTELRVDGVKHPFYIATSNLPILLDYMDRPVPEENTRILAPLDNFLWDRKLTDELFGFEYRWEVYVPASKRQYGYYVLPVLRGNRFVGRIEMRTDKAERILNAESFWWEDGAERSRDCAKDVRACLRRFAAYNRCGKLKVRFALK